MSERWEPLGVRFWRRVNRTETCWLWTGSRANEYGSIISNGRKLLAHRVAWELTNGPIADGLTIDHLCCVKLCVNPSHLEPVTRGENMRRWARSITACPFGHPYDVENTYWYRGHRNCRHCRRDKERRRQQLRKLRRSLASSGRS